VDSPSSPWLMCGRQLRPTVHQLSYGRQFLDGMVEHLFERRSFFAYMLLRFSGAWRGEVLRHCPAIGRLSPLGNQRCTFLQLVELKNGETYNGHLVNCDTWMNIHLREVICTSKVISRVPQSAVCTPQSHLLYIVRHDPSVLDKLVKAHRVITLFWVQHWITVRRGVNKLSILSCVLFHNVFVRLGLTPLCSRPMCKS
jgi:small nuclear ribonucleoprotein (snRNP)-like protein